MTDEQKIQLDNNPVHEAMLFYWGERCPEHEDGCPVCDAWELYDNMVDKKSEYFV